MKLIAIIILWVIGAAIIAHNLATVLEFFDVPYEDGSQAILGIFMGYIICWFAAKLPLE